MKKRTYIDRVKVTGEIWWKLGFAWRFRLLWGGIFISIIASILFLLSDDIEIMVIMTLVIIFGLSLSGMGYKFCRQFQIKYLNGRKIWSPGKMVEYFKN